MHVVAFSVTGKNEHYFNAGYFITLGGINLMNCYADI